MSHRALMLVSSALIALGCFPAAAQEFRAMISGRIVDPSGMTIPQADVSVVNTATQVRSTARTGSDGNFVLPQLPPGTYDLTAEAKGFRTYTRRGMTLAVGDRASVDVKLEIGDAASSVTVEAQLTGIESNQDITGQLMDNANVNNLPLNGRQVYMLVQLSSGVVFTQQFFGPGGFSGTRAYDVNGLLSVQGSVVGSVGSNAFMLDGAPLGVGGQWTYAPVVDAIEEYKVVTPASDASQGFTGGGVVNMTMKSGGNSLHGALSWFLRNQIFDAVTTQANALAATRPDQAYYQHQFNDASVVVTGPFIKNKFFYLGSYEGFWDRVPRAVTQTVPTLLQRNGDFSQTFNASGQLVTIYDPLTTQQVGSAFTRTAFPGNLIPSNRIAQPSRNILGYLPLPNITTNPVTNFNNLGVAPNVGKFAYNSWFMKFDYVWNDKHRTFFSETQNYGSNNSSNNGLPTGNPAKVGSDPARRNHYGTTLNHIYSMNSTTILDIRLAWDRYLTYLFQTTADSTDGSQLGFQGQTGSFPLPRFPSLTFTNYMAMGNTGDNYLPVDTYTIAANVSRMVNRHFLRFGTRLGQVRSSTMNTGVWFGAFAFSPAWTQANPLSASTTSGNDMASFMLGYPNSGSTTTNALASVQNKAYSMYVQDDIKLTPTLTVNLGLRWDVQTAPTERFNRNVYTFDPAATYAFGPGQAVGRLVFADSSRRQPWDTKVRDFQPRTGVAWRASRKIVFRTGYGLSVVPLNGDGGNGGVDQTGFSFVTPFVATLGGGVNAYVPGLPGTGTFVRPYPNGILAPQLPAVPYGQAITFQNRDYVVPRVHQFNVGLGFDLPWRTLLEVSYVGSRTRKYPVAKSLSAIPLAERLKGVADPTYLTAAVPNPFFGAAQLVGTSLNSATTSRSQSLSPFPQFTSVTENGMTLGASSFNALEVRINKRLSSGISTTVSYTFSKTMLSTAFLEPQYTAPEHVLASYDRSQHLTVSSLLQVPIGRGKRFGSHWSKTLDTFVGNWQFNIIYEYMTGTPTAMPNAIPLRNPILDNQTYNRWFDTCTLLTTGVRSGCASTSDPVTWMQLAPNQLRTDSTYLPNIRNDWKPNVNLSVFKEFPIKERARVELRGEAFNATNTPIYQGPTTSITSPLFGRVTLSQQNFARNMQFALRVRF